MLCNLYLRFMSCFFGVIKITAMVIMIFVFAKYLNNDKNNLVVMYSSTHMYALIPPCELYIPEPNVGSYKADDSPGFSDASQ